MQTTPHMGLTVWNQTTDLFDHTELAADFEKIDSHDHSPGKGPPVGNAGLASGAVTLDKVAPSLLASFVPTGAVLPYAGTTAPAGFLMCDGAQYSTFLYNTLFRTIGTSFGSAPTGFFLVPNLQQRFPLGKAPSGTGSTLGGTGGAIDHVHTVPGLSLPGLSIPSLGVNPLPCSVSLVPHDHTMGSAFTEIAIASNFGHTAFVGNLAGTFNTGLPGPIWTDSGSAAWGFTTGAYFLQTGFQVGGTTDSGGTTSGSGSTGSGSTVSATTGGGTSGSGTTGSANPPYVVVNYIIKY